VLLVDDIFSTGGTLKMASQACKQAGAKSVYAAVTHGLCVGEGWRECVVEKMIVSNTVRAPEGIDEKTFHTVSVAPLFAMAIESIIGSKSISSYYG
jgi:ribose-phosphate pyrophosphokinase